MDWTEVGKTAASLGLKVVGGALGGPAGATVGGMVATALGLDADANPAQVDTALKTASPEQIVELKRLENENAADIRRHQLGMASLEAEREKARLADVANARARDVQIRQAGQSNDRAGKMVLMDVAGLVLSLLAAVVLAIWMKEPPQAIITLLITFGSYFGLSLRDAHTFEFGSSRGSKEKDAQIASAVPLREIQGLPWLKTGGG